MVKSDEDTIDHLSNFAGSLPGGSMRVMVMVIMLEIMIMEIMVMMTMIVMMMSTIWQIRPGLYPQGHGGASKELSRPPDWSSPNHINLVPRDWSSPTIMISYFVCGLY